MAGEPLASSAAVGWPAQFLEIPATSSVCACVCDDDATPPEPPAGCGACHEARNFEGQDCADAAPSGSSARRVKVALADGDSDGSGTERSESDNSSARHPLIAALPELPQYIRLLRADHLVALPTPMPRSQDVDPACFGVPAAGDLVLAVSHAWPHQAHPDAGGQKLASVLECARNIGLGMDRVFLFFDFLSIPQRPFRLGQGPRTPEDTQRFAGALQRMHWVFFYADLIMHLESPAPEVEEEGSTYQLPGAALFGASLGEIGGWIQVVGIEDALEPRTPCTPKSAKKVQFRQHNWALLDRLCRAGDEEVSSLEQIRRRMGAPDFEACPVDLQRFPFGRPNRLPASERGWVFLERFITMVKCSMLAPDQVEGVIVATADHTLAQVREGANVLRKAANSDAQARVAGREGQQLGHALETFMLELRTKVFSSTSVDKALNQVQVEVVHGPSLVAAAGGGDVDIVFGLMRLFIDQLKFRWDEFEHTQRKRTNIMGRIFIAAVGIALEWEGFSTAYTARLLRGAEGGGGGWAALVLLLEPVAVLSPYLLLRSRPDVDWREAADFWCLIWPLQSYVGVAALPLMLDELLGVRRAGAVAWLRSTAWVAFAGTNWQIPVILAAAVFDVFPVPFANLLGFAVTFPVSLFMLYFLVPPDLRVRQDIRTRLMYALAVIAAYTAIGMGLYPVSAAFFQASGALLQAAMLFVVFATRLVFESIGTAAAKRLGADIMPMILFCAVYAYQYQLSTLLLTIKHWLVFLELLGVNVAVKAYYLLELRRMQRRMPPRAMHMARSVSDETAAPESKMQRIVVLMVLRQLVELLATVHFLMLVLATHYLSPALFGWSTNTQKAGLFESLQYLLLFLVSDLCLFGLTSNRLRKAGYVSLHTARALANAHLPLFVAVCNTLLYMYVSFQVPHFGADMSFSFQWVRHPGARWGSGLTWED